MHVEYKDSSRTLYSILDTPANLHETLERFSETDSEHEERQKRHRDTFLAFRDRLTEQECHIILDHCGLDAFRTMMGLNPDIADRQHFGRHQVFGKKPNLGDGKLAEIAGRSKSNLSRTLKTMSRYGLVELTEGERGTLVPRVPYDQVRLDVSLTAGARRVA